MITFMLPLKHVAKASFNPVIATLKLHSNGQSYSNTVIGTMAGDEWAVIFGTARRGLWSLKG